MRRVESWKIENSNKNCELSLANDLRRKQMFATKLELDSVLKFKQMYNTKVLTLHIHLSEFRQH